jgi:alanyl-tRNA synthetase
MMENLELHWIKCAYKTCRRGGNFIIDVFKKEEKHLTAEDCMKLKNYYGIRSFDIVKMVISHDFTMDDEGFANLLIEEKEEMKKVKMCIAS